MVGCEAFVRNENTTKHSNWDWLAENMRRPILRNPRSNLQQEDANQG